MITPKCLPGMVNLAGTYKEQENLDTARALCRQILDVERTVLGPDHTSTMITTDNLATVMEVRDRCEKSREMYAVDSSTKQAYSLRRPPGHTEHC